MQKQQSINYIINIIYYIIYSGNPSALDYDDRVLSTRHKHVWSVPLQKVVSRPTLTHISDKRQKGLYTQPGELDVNISQTSPRVPTFDMSKSAY